MAEEFAVNMATKAAESLISQIWQDLQCLLNYNSNIKNLKEKVKDLESEQNTIQLEIDAAKRDDQVIGHNVLNWMDKVDNIKKEVDEILTRTRNTQWGCLYCKCPKLHSWHKLSKQALGWTTEVTKLLQDEGKFGRIGHPKQPGQTPFASPGEFDSFKSRMRIWNGVMEALKDDSIPIIGICGMGGVGKTTLVKEIADKVKAGELFHEVAMAVVSNNPVVSNIQNQLAENLGLKFEEMTDRGRAERLSSRLKNDNKRILVILDDLWEKLDLHNIGIPVKGECGGLKVLLTSRYKRVCVYMEAKPLEVNVLSEEESWHLFKKIAEIPEAENEIKDIAKEVTKECGGLPLAIVTIGGVLKNREDYAWRDVLEEMKEDSVTNIPEMEKLVLSRIKLSYKYLHDDSKLLLLLCSLFPEDCNIRIEDLVRYTKGLHFSKSGQTVARLRDKVYSIADELKSCYLLLEGDKEKSIKLHDVIRDVCSSIASSGEHIHLVRHGGLMEWPQEEGSASCTAIALTFDKIDQLTPGLDYPKLKLLKLSFQEHKLHMREDFFERMKEIKVLELCNLNSELPLSLQLLVNLRTLCFHECKLYGNLSVIGSQEKIEILSFYNSYLEDFPNKIAELSNLKSLDLRFKNGPPLPSDILARLKKLEELYLGSFFQEWENKGAEAYTVITTETSSLSNLQTIQFYAYGNHCLEQVLENLHQEKLIRFEITSITDDKGVGEYQFGKVLTLKKINADLVRKHAAQCLLSKTEDLSLEIIDGLTNLVSELDGKGFVNLKKLNIESCDLKCLVDATSFRTSGGGAFIRNAENVEILCHGNLPVGSFARLREVTLQNLPALRHLWGTIQQPSLGNLRILIIYECPSIGSLFLRSSVKCLRQLQQMKILWCKQLETVVSNDEEDDTGDIEFPMLKTLYLYT